MGSTLVRLLYVNVVSEVELQQCIIFYAAVNFNCINYERQESCEKERKMREEESRSMVVIIAKGE